MLMQLHDHKRRLKEIQSVERKADAKREMLPEYAAYIDGVIESGAGVQDDVLMTTMVWRVDVSDIPGALDIGAYALAHHLKTPEQYNRDTATLLAEEVSEQALRLQGPGEASQLLRAEEMTRGHDMPDEVRAKLHKAIGIALSDIDAVQAVEHLDRSIQLHEKGGAKKLREQVARNIKPSEPKEESQPPATGQGPSETPEQQPAQAD
jgi:hypothetical protein